MPRNGSWRLAHASIAKIGGTATSMGFGISVSLPGTATQSFNSDLILRVICGYGQQHTNAVYPLALLGARYEWRCGGRAD
jgi:hypothetical protein